jgi:hypothetical protein
MMRPFRHRPDDDGDAGDVENTTINTNRKNNNDENNNQEVPSSSSLSSSWKQEEDPISQGIVSALTAVVNAFSFNTNTNKNKIASAAETPPLSSSSPPTNAEELMRRIACDYAERNYLWTGDLDYTCYEENCRFADPTLTFTSTATYARNVGNLVPIVDRWVDKDGGGPRSELISIRLVVEGDSNNYNKDTSSSSSATSSSSASSSSKSFVQTRWNMVGDLRLPWRPRIDVMGQTRFWFDTTNDDGGVRIYHYDETWEIPPWRALLQLVTPAGMIPNSSIDPATLFDTNRDAPNYTK